MMIISPIKQDSKNDENGEKEKVTPTVTDRRKIKHNRR